MKRYLGKKEVEDECWIRYKVTKKEKKIIAANEREEDSYECIYSPTASSNSADIENETEEQKH